MADRRKIFDTFRAARLLIDELRRIEEEGACIWLAWVVMPDHFHGLLSLSETIGLSTLMQRVKGRSGKSINTYLGIKGKSFWQPGFYDHALRRDEDRKGVARYIIFNPVRAGLTTNVYDYPHWDAVYL